MLNMLLKMDTGQFRGFSKAYDSGCIFRTGSLFIFLGGQDYLEQGIVAAAVKE